MTDFIDFRSDTVTRPSAEMRSVMAAAEVGDDAYGDDPSVRALQERVADILGFDEAIFLPSGTQSNLCAILAHCQRGDEYLVGQMAHCYRWEGGGAAVLGSVQPQPLEHLADMTFDLGTIEAAIKPDDIHFARTRLLALENTIMGRVLPTDYIEAATALAADHDLSAHLDGARLFNAAVSLAGNGDPVAMAARIAGHFDSVSVCFSKGLGAPVGSALCGSSEFIRRARRIRKMLGGVMRQSGILAAAAEFALDRNIPRLAEDHRRARTLAEGISTIPGIKVGPIDTNIVTFSLLPETKLTAGEFIISLRDAGLLVSGAYDIRFVTHLGIDDSDIERAIELVTTCAHDLI